MGRHFAIIFFGLGILAIAVSAIREKEPLYFPPIPEKNRKAANPAAAELGRYLFYDPILSKEKQLACSSCHLQKFAFADSSTFSKGQKQKSVGRNTLPLFNLPWYEAFFWDGRAASLEEQISHPIKDSNELNSSWELILARLNERDFYRKKFWRVFQKESIDSMQVIEAISQFERRLISANSKFDQVMRGEAYLDEDEYAGFLLVNDQTKGNCLHCHTSDANALGTIGRFSNNGLTAASNPSDFNDPGMGGVSGNDNDYGRFKIPSLRNLLFTAPYMHDGRFKTLKEVLDFYSDSVRKSYSIDPKMEIHLGQRNLNEQEKFQIIAFLKTMSDSSFVSDSSLSTPF